MAEGNLQTETLILIVYAIIEVIGIIGNIYVICWSICGSKKGFLVNKTNDIFYEIHFCSAKIWSKSLKVMFAQIYLEQT